MRRATRALGVLSIVVLLGFLVSGCADFYPHSLMLPRGSIYEEHPKPPAGAYYRDWDPFAASIELTPATSVNPAGTQHVLVATVRDKNGKPLPNRRVEWMITQGSVGAIVEVDESGFWCSRGYKVDTTYAVSKTNNGDHTLTRGTPDTSDDIHLTRGQTWCVITSAEEGETHVVAYAPAIYNWEKHKAFAVKSWRDVKVIWPEDAVNPIGTDHRLITRVVTSADGRPKPGYWVTYQIVGGPSAVLMPGDGQTVKVTTDYTGTATATLRQLAPQKGANKIQIDVSGMGESDKKPALIGTGMMTKTWEGTSLQLTKTAPASVLANAPFDYTIKVTNLTNIPAYHVTLEDTLPDGVSYVSSNPPAQVSRQSLTWRFGTLAGRQTWSIPVTVRATRGGRFVNAAVVKADGDIVATASATVFTAVPAMAFEVGDLEDPIEVGANVTYEIAATNQGSTPNTNVRIVATIPSEGEYVSSTGPTEARVSGKIVTFDPLATLAPGAKATYRVVMKAVGVGDARLRTAMTSDQVTKPVEEVESTHLYK